MTCRKFALSQLLLLFLLFLLSCAILPVAVAGFGALPCAAQNPAPTDKSTAKPQRMDPKQTGVEKVAPVAVAVTTDKKIYAVGTPIQLTLTVRNTTKEDVHLTFSSGQKFDFMIRRGAKSDGLVLWQWSHGKAFVEMLSSSTLQPGKTQIYHAMFEPQGAAKGEAAKAGKPVTFAPGTYTVSGILTIMQPTARPSGATTFQIK